MSENRYPGPASSMSQPDRVLPSLVNCTARGAGLLGPSVNWKRANNDPTPRGKIRKTKKVEIKEYIKIETRGDFNLLNYLRFCEVIVAPLSGSRGRFW